MLPATRLKALHERKQELLGISAVQRELLSLECARIGQRLEGLHRGVMVARRLWPFGALVIPLFKLWSSRRSRSRQSLFATIAGAVPIVLRLAGMWREFGRS